jgi:SET domain-containing protein
VEAAWTVLKEDIEIPVAKIDELIFAEPSIKALIKKKCDRFLKLGFRSKMNRFSLALFEQDFILKKMPPVEIQYIDSLVGFGVFATQTIPGLTYVGEYVGVVREKTKKPDQSNDYIFRYLGSRSFFKSFVIDAEEKGNFTRFINHSDEPNLTSRWLIHDDVYHVIFFTNQKIEKGHQLTYDYGPYYWTKRAKPLSI